MWLFAGRCEGFRELSSSPETQNSIRSNGVAGKKMSNIEHANGTQSCLLTWWAERQVNI